MEPIRAIIADLVYPEGRERRNQAERDACTDSLTGVANRRALQSGLPLAEANPEQCIIFGDGDGFGLLNKRAGHKAGDEAIQHMANAFSAHTSRVFRYGGDEFVAIVPAIRGETTRRAIEETFGLLWHHALSFGITCGVGQTLADAELDMQRRKPRK